MQVLKVGAVPRAAELFVVRQIGRSFEFDDVRAPIGELTHGGRTRANAGEIKHGEA